jgi:DNA-binding NarL/FixJ family response regulator
MLLAADRLKNSSDSLSPSYSRSAMRRERLRAGAQTLTDTLARHLGGSIETSGDVTQLHTNDPLLSDISMPGLDGICLAAQTKALQPDCAILLLSAQSEDTSISERIRSL